MGQMFCALVLLFVICSVDAWSIRRNSEQEETLCSQDHPLYPYIKLFNVIPEEWKSENDNNSKKKTPVCFTRIVTTETDENGNKLNKFSSYELTFGVPVKYQSLLDKQSDDTEEFVNYPPFDETIMKDGKTTKNVVYIRCSKNNEEPSTTPSESEIVHTRRLDTTYPPDITTVNHDLDFITELDEICEEHLDIDLLNTLPDDDATPEPDFGNTRRNGGDFIDYTTDGPNVTTITTKAIDDTSTEYTTIQPKEEEEDDEEEEEEPSILTRMDGTLATEVTTELTNLITQILDEMNNSITTTQPTTVQQDYTVIITTLPDDVSNSEQTVQPEITTQQPVTEDIRKNIETVTDEVRKSEEQVTEEIRKSEEQVTEEIKKSDELNAFIIQVKNIASINSHAKCYLINSKIKYGKCTKPIVPIRILTESKLPQTVKLELVENLENSSDSDEIIVSGQKDCYLLKNLTSSECPANHDDMATVLVIDDLPDNPHDDSYFTIEFDRKCTAVSKHIDVIDCPIYQDTLPHLKTEHLPDQVRFKHNPGVIDVHVDDIIVHSYSHCLLLKTMKDIGCRGKPNIVLEEDEHPEPYTDDIKTLEFISEEDSLPTYRLGDYSLENSNESEEFRDPLTTPCNSEEDDTLNSDANSRTTRTLPYPVTEAPELDRKSKNDCNDKTDVNCLMKRIEKQTKDLKTRRTLKPHLNNTKDTESTTPVPTTITPTTEITEITIPNSRKLTKLLKTIIDESTKEPMPQSEDVFKPDFIVKVGCAQQVFKSSCFYVSKYIMKPSFDDPHDYNQIIDKSLLPADVKIVSAPNLKIFEANETIYAASRKEKFVLIKKKEVACPADPTASFFILDTGSCAAERRDDYSIIKYQKGNKVYCFDFDDDMRLHKVKCPEDLTVIPELSRPEDLKTLCRSQLKNRGHNEQMKLLRRLNIVTFKN